MSDLENRVAKIEQRLAKIEAYLKKIIKGELAQPGTPAQPKTPPPLPTVQARKEAVRNEAAGEKSLSVTNILGWGGATALVLAASYVIRLAIDSGWLTPERQIASVVLGGLALIGVGIGLRNTHRRYASLLPAGGIVILFLSIYGAHLYYNLIDGITALGAIIVVCIASLWLCKLFRNEMYAMFAAVGSYSAPFLLPSLGNNITDLVIYFSSWSIVYCIYSIWLESRRIYLLALYLALIGFDIIWRNTTSDQWVAAFVFQAFQFTTFAGCTTFFSISRNSPLSRNSAIAHIPALLIFYFLQYSLLYKNIPAYAPWIAGGSAAVLALCYMIARTYFKRSMEGGRLLLSTYCALVLFHAGYIESVPFDLAPWVAFFLLPMIVAYGLVRRSLMSVGWPVLIVVGIIFIANYFRLISNWHFETVPWHNLLIVLYAVELYLGYYFLRRNDSHQMLVIPVINGGHICLMAAAIHIFDSRFAVSLSWGCLALACLIVSLSKKDKILGQSSLFVFAASAAKALLYDLSSAAPVVRIACLLVLGVTFYIGGWLYRKVNAMEGPK